MGHLVLKGLVVNLRTVQVARSPGGGWGVDALMEPFRGVVRTTAGPPDDVVTAGQEAAGDAASSDTDALRF